MGLRRLVTLHVRRIVAEACAWSFGGVNERTRIIHRVDARKIIAHRISELLDVDVPAEKWTSLPTIGHLVDYLLQQLGDRSQEEACASIYEPASD